MPKNAALPKTYRRTSVGSTFGTTVTLEKGVPIETVSEMLGHKQITTTQIYAKLTANKMKEDVRLLTQRIGNLYELTQPTTRLLSKEA